MKKRVWLILYLVFVLALLGGMAFVLSRLWSFAEAYEANCAETLLSAACDRVSRETGLSLSYSSVPTVEENGDLGFVLRDGKRPVGRVVLRVKEKGPFSLILYETESVSGTVSCRVEAPEGVRVRVGTTAPEPVSSVPYPGTEPLEGLDAAKAPPLLLTYEIGGLYSDAQIVTEADWPFDRGLDDGTIVITRRAKTPEEAEALRNRAVKLAEAYSKYVSHDWEWGTAAGFFMAGSPLRTSLPTMEVQWYATHEKSALANVSVEEPVFRSDRYAEVTLRYDYIITRNGKDYTYPIGLALTVHLDDDGVWRTALLNPNID